MPRKKHWLLPSLLTLLAPLARAETSILPANANSGFEANLADWTVSPASPASTTPVAATSYAYASIGLRGLRLQDTAEYQTYTITSKSYPASAGTYRLTFWARSLVVPSSGICARLVFKDASGAQIYGSTPQAITDKNVIWFAKNTVDNIVAPSGTASVSVVFLSTGGKTPGGAYIDDIEIVLKGGTPLPSKYTAHLLEIGNDPSRGKAPPKIVLKLDDLTNGTVANYQIVATELATQQVKANIGIICKNLEAPSQALRDFINNRAGTWVEFCHHGVTHDAGEFSTTTEAQQSDTLKKGSDLFQAVRQGAGVYGARLKTLGTPNNLFNSNTRNAFMKDPDMKVWLFADEGFPDADAGNKVLLRRATSVNLENPTPVPNHESFIEGYAHNRGSAYFVLQGHAGGYVNQPDTGNARFDEFKRTIAFLKRADINASFVFASSFAP